LKQKSIAFTPLSTIPAIRQRSSTTASPDGALPTRRQDAVKVADGRQTISRNLSPTAIFPARFFARIAISNEKRAGLTARYCQFRVRGDHLCNADRRISHHATFAASAVAAGTSANTRRFIHQDPRFLLILVNNSTISRPARET
jgi:hypothetical protein